MVLTLISFGINSAPTPWELVPDQSQISFTAIQNGSAVEGGFNNFTANLRADIDDLEHSSIDVVIDINSVYAKFNEIKETLLSKDWFNVKLFPQAEFKAMKFSKTGEHTYEALGTLTLRDKTQPVTLTFTPTFPDTHTGIVEGTTVIHRTAFGAGQGGWSAVDQIQDDVTVHFKITAMRK
jgi:polyisoprenoid-binding protein YceI